MKIQVKKYFYWLVSLVAIFTILFTVYVKLGGLIPVKVVASEGVEYTLVGREVSGRGIEQLERKVFIELKEYLSSGELKGILCLIDYNDNDSLEFGIERRFIGVLLENDVSIVPGKFEFVEFQSNKVLMSALSMHPLVMPNAEIVETQIKSYADSIGMNLRNFTLEKLFDDNSVVVEMYSVEDLN